MTVSESGRWSVSESCSEAKSSMCKIELATQPGGQGDLGEAKCDPGWNLFVGNTANCYRNFLEAADFGQASATCADHLAYLISFHSDLEIKFAQSLSGNILFLRVKNKNII